MPDNKNPPPLPVVLELAPLPREQIGPFLILGTPIDANQEQIEASWAKRVIWARKKQVGVPLEDINWARQTLNDPNQRVEVEMASLSIDAADGFLHHLQTKYQNRTENVAELLMDIEVDFSDYTPPVDIPDPEAILQSITIPELSMQFPMAVQFLHGLVQDPEDPWELDAPENP